jgi:quinoprotein dehydrogenase-associated probable ABC transporter substrate-binding protein
MRLGPASILGLGALALTAAAPPSLAPDQAVLPKPKLELRVCATPDNLPFSNEQGEGFENKIAALIARDMGLPLHYTFHPQRRGFVRRTLNAGACNLLMGAPTGLEMLVTTKPYYRSTYVFVTRADRKLGLKSLDDPALRKLRIGLHAVGDDGSNPPPGHSLAKRGIVSNVVGYKLWDVATVKNPQGAIIDAVARGEIDVAIVWGPFAGYFAQKQPVALTIVPVPPDIASLPFEYDISFGVRKGNDIFKRRLEAILDKRRDDIRAILAGYGVPLVDKPALAAAGATAKRPQGGEQKKE